MKKKLLALATTVLMIFSFAGCSTEGTALMGEMEKVAAWEATEQTGSMDMGFTAGETSGKLSLDYTAYTITNDLQMEMTVSPKSLEVNGATLDLTKGDYKLSPIKMYMDGVKMYMSSSYLKEVCALAGADASEAIDVSKDYVAFDMTDTYAQMGIDVKELTKDSAKVSKEFYAGLDDTDLSIKQDGRTYTIELTADQMVEACFKAMTKSMEMQKDTLEAQYKAMGLTDEQIKEVMAQVSAVFSDETAKTVKDMVKGSTAKVVLGYTDEEQTTDIALNAKVAVEDQEVTVSFAMKDAAKKAAKKEVKMPTSVTVYTMDDLMSLASTADAAATEDTTEAATEAADTTEETAVETTTTEKAA